ncbi:MAG: HPF/RaiA family ribosome-associated protein [Acidobacteriota bacterium]
MTLPVQITFRNMQSSDAIEALIRDRAAKLENYYNRILGCRVLVEVPNRHHLRGRHRHIKIDLVVPDEELVINHEPNLHAKKKQLENEEYSKSEEWNAPHKDIKVAIREAFDVAKRRLLDYAQRKRLDVKQHSRPAIKRRKKVEIAKTEILDEG